MALTIEQVSNQAGFKKLAPTVVGYYNAAKDFGANITVEQAIDKCNLTEEWKKAFHGGQAGLAIEEFRSSLSGEQMSKLRKAMQYAGKNAVNLTFDLNGATVTSTSRARFFDRKAE